MNVRSELRRLRRQVADMPDAPTARLPFARFWLWAEGTVKTPDLTAAERDGLDAHSARCDDIALATPLGEQLRAERRRLGLPETDAVPADAVDEVLRLAALPSPDGSPRPTTPEE